jgi:hypothetical protein
MRDDHLSQTMHGQWVWRPGANFVELVLAATSHLMPHSVLFVTDVVTIAVEENPCGVRGKAKLYQLTTSVRGVG